MMKIHIERSSTHISVKERFNRLKGLGHHWLILNEDVKDYKTNGIKLLLFGYIICGQIKSDHRSYDSRIYKAIIKIIIKDS